MPARRTSIFVAVLIASMFGVPSTSTAQLEDAVRDAGSAAEEVGSVVPQVPETPDLPLPSAPPPQASPPQAPPPHASAPAPPSGSDVIRSVPQVRPGASPLEAPDPESPRSAIARAGDSTGSGSGVVPRAAGVSAGAEETARTDTNASMKGEESRGNGPARVGSGSGSVGQTQVAAVPHWIAYVWPAFAARGAANLLASLLSGEEAVTSTIGGVPRLLLGFEDSGAARVAGLSQQSGISNSPSTDSPGSSGLQISDGDALALFVFIASGAALMALLAFTLRRELRAMYRWPHR
jgi:hypothetical protein